MQVQAAGLDEKPGKRKVGLLLKCMGINAIKVYDTFEWNAAVPAVQADEERGIASVDAVPAENKDDLQTVFKKFDKH